MTSGLGINIGTVNVVSARIGAQDARPTVRTRRTAVGFDSGGTARLGGITRFSTAVSEFADLGRNPESVYVDGRIWSPATIFASVVQGLVAAEPATGVVATYPAGYSRKQLALLHQSLDLAGVGHVQLVPEPVAAARWLDTEHGPLDTGFVLVYDLGGNSLDVSVVRTGPDWPDHPVVGKPVRSYEFGGRPLGALIARCAGDRAIGPAEPSTGAVSLMSFVNPEGLRREHVRDSLEVVRSAVRSAGVALSDISRVLVVGGAARPPQVAGTLAELGLPVTIAADSGQCVALGAAAMAAESVAGTGSARAKHPPIFSGAALFSAVAMSAATILGSGPADTGPVDQDRIPLQSPGAVRYEIHGEARVERSGTGWTVSYAPLGPAALVAPAAASRLFGPPMPGAESTDRPGHLRSDRSSGTHNSARDGHEQPAAHRDDPARFGHPLPSERSGVPGRGAGPGSEPGPGAGDPPGSEPPGPQDGGEQDPGGGAPDADGPGGAGSPSLPTPGGRSDGDGWTGGPGGWPVPGGGDGGDTSGNGSGSAPGDQNDSPGGAGGDTSGNGSGSAPGDQNDSPGGAGGDAPSGDQGASPGEAGGDAPSDQGASPGGNGGDTGSGGSDSGSGGPSSAGGSDSSSGGGGDTGHSGAGHSGGGGAGDSSGGADSAGGGAAGGHSSGAHSSDGGDSTGGSASASGGASASGRDSSGGSKSSAGGADSGGSRSGGDGGSRGGSSRGGSRN